MQKKLRIRNTLLITYFYIDLCHSNTNLNISNMKKLLLLLFVFAFGFTNAQKGTILVQGSFSYSSQKESYPNQDIKVESFKIDPKIGFQFSNNWTAGIEGSFGKSTGQNFTGAGTNGIEARGLSAGAFVRYSRPLTDLFSVYADLGAGFINTKRTDYITQQNFDSYFSTRTTSKGSGFYASLTPAMFINLKKGFGLNFNIGGIEYHKINYTTEVPDFTIVNVNFGNVVNIGVSKSF